MSNRSCLNCFNCNVKVDLVPLTAKGGRRKFKHSNAVAEELLNSKMIFREVRCGQGMWATKDGKEFIYRNFSDMMHNTTQTRLKFAEKCMRYNP